ncbi:hypothetical protein BKA70DRAFT_1426804 [Coprinopsis sp. MPI-PUGE-AT-0042]|nr:hypothetical protein BKA70DRAFT_1426804 [Coprinopsis sp. MPI-PUGE-AT-0042]
MAGGIEAELEQNPSARSSLVRVYYQLSTMSSTTTVKSKLLPFTVSNDPLPDKLKPLLDEQLEIYDKHIDSSQRTLFELEGKIRAFEKELEELKMKKDDEQHRLEGLRGTKAALRSSVSAVRRLPAEIIASIIQLAVNNGASDRFGGEKAAFMVLRCVSKVWRRTAFSTPSLWKNVNLALSEFLGDHGEAKSNLFTALDTWFSRAGGGTGLTLLVLGHGPRVLGADDIVAWIQQSHFNIFHLSFYHPIDSADSLKSLCREKALSLSETTRLVVSNPQRPLFHSGSNDIPTIDMSLAFPKLKGIGWVPAGDKLTCWRPSTLLIHPTLARIELGHWAFHSTEVSTISLAFPNLTHMVLSNCVAVSPHHPAEQKSVVHSRIH